MRWNLFLRSISFSFMVSSKYHCHWESSSQSQNHQTQTHSSVFSSTRVIIYPKWFRLVHFPWHWHIYESWRRWWCWQQRVAILKAGGILGRRRQWRWRRRWQWWWRRRQTRWWWRWGRLFTTCVSTRAWSTLDFSVCWLSKHWRWKCNT